MLFTPEIVSAFETIISAAENDFEMYRIKSLLKDLTAPPQPEVIDDTHQKFNGKIYTKSKSGHYRASFQLHRDIWEYYPNRAEKPLALAMGMKGAVFFEKTCIIKDVSV